MARYQERNRLEIRQSIGRNLGAVIVSEVTSTGSDAFTLIDDYELQGGDDEYKGRQVMINTPAGSISAGEKSFVYSSNEEAFTANIRPTFTAAPTDGDTYEMWEDYRIEEINDYINQAIVRATDRFLNDKVTSTTFTKQNEYEYGIPTGFLGVSKVEYVAEVKESIILESCDVLWDEQVDGDVTATIDTALEETGSGCMKFVISADVSAGDIIASQDITSTDLTGMTHVNIWVYSTVALDAGDVKLLLDNTASCDSPVETLSVPATTANTGTWHTIALANPASDGAIISVGLEMDQDKDAMTLYVDGIEAINSYSRSWRELPSSEWDIVKGSTAYLRLTKTGYGITGKNTLLRITGYQLPSIFTTDSTDADLPPEYIIDAVTGDILLNHYKGRNTDTKARLDRGAKYLASARDILLSKSTPMTGEVRWL